MYLILDFETKDPYIGLKLGSGWAYKLHVPTSQFKVLGFSSALMDDNGNISNLKYTHLPEGLEYLQYLIAKYPRMIAHNAQYELGCLLSLDIDISKIRVFDTKIMGFLFDNRLFSYSLDPLSKKYLPPEYVKRPDLLRDAAATLIKSNPANKTHDAKCLAFAYSNMDVMQDKFPAIVAEYANADALAAGELFKVFLKGMTADFAEYWCKSQKVCVNIRKRGIWVDMVELRRAIAEMTPLCEQARRKAYELLGVDDNFNIDSPKQLASVLNSLGYTLPKTEKGGDSVDKYFLKEQHDAICDAILAYRELDVLLNNTLIKIKDMQEYTCPEACAVDSKYGRIFPELNVFGAETGRFSSSAPNIQQIPKRNKQWGKILRGIFIPDPHSKKTWISIDWSNQEGRLQIHYGKKINAPRIDQTVDKFNTKPDYDLHTEVATTMSCDRDIGKGINLGISYGMGKPKLARTLRVSENKAEKLLTQFNNSYPYLSMLAAECKSRLRKNGAIFTIGGRTSKRDFHNGQNFDYKALNKLIQGSAADQCIAALIQADEAGLEIICVVHDEFNVQGDRTTAETMARIMLTCTPLEIPSFVEISMGESWGKLKTLENNYAINTGILEGTSRNPLSPARSRD